MRFPVEVRDKGGSVQRTVATVSLAVDLPAHFKGTHMSRFVEVLHAQGAEVTVARSDEDTAAVTFDLAGMPGNAVLVVERRLGPKSPYMEVARTAQDEGVVTVDLPSTSRVVVRASVVGTRGSVLLRTELRL